MPRKNLIGNRYGRLVVEEMLFNYKNNKTYARCKCDCEKIGIYRKNDIQTLHTQSCGCINSSTREKLIEEFIKDCNYDYKTQFTFDDLKSDKNYVLRFDFVIYKNNKINLVEYDGEQHYKPIEVYGGQKGFNEGQIRDKQKDDYCKKNNLNLIRIPYWETNDEIKNIIQNI